MTRAEIYDISNKYFSMSQAETDRYLDKFNEVPEEFRNQYKIRAQYILKCVAEHCKDFVDVSDEKLKRKVGKVVLSKLDYSKFGDETPRETYERIDRLFAQVVDRGINPYKIIYCSVLTDGNLRVDYDGNKRFYDRSRDFDSIYHKLKTTLKLSDEETVALFEKCSTLIAKVSTDKITQVYDCVKNLTTGSYELATPLFDKQETIEILKINPSLFTSSREKIIGAVKYLEGKIEPQMKELKPLYANPSVNYVANKRQILRNWIKNNTSLLALNADNMRAKEYFLDSNNVYGSVHPDYVTAVERAIDNVFSDRINLALVSNMPIEKIKKNAFSNISSLSKIAGPRDLGKYIEKNPLFLGMKHSDVKVLLDNIALSSEKGTENMDRFLEYGRTLFASNIEFKPNEIFEKLTSNQAMMKIDLDNMQEEEYVSKFAEIFMEDDDLAFEVEELIKEKDRRTKRGEKQLRKDIRLFGNNLDDLPLFIKEKDLKLDQKRNLILAYAHDVQDLTERRFQLANSNDIEYVRKKEYNDSKKIETVLNKLRDIYEQKRFKVGKRYQNSDLLFENMMDYLGRCFDDKEALYEVFSKEVAQKYAKVMEEHFNVKQEKQLAVFENDVVIQDINPALIAPLKELTKSVEATEKEIDVKHVTFER